jgi:hypothetical protein
MTMGTSSAYCLNIIVFFCNKQAIPKYFVGSEVLTAVVMKTIIFWDITPCSPLSVNGRFGRTYRLHLQALKNKLRRKAA